MKDHRAKAFELSKTSNKYGSKIEVRRMPLSADNVRSLKVSQCPQHTATSNLKNAYGFQPA